MALTAAQQTKVDVIKSSVDGLKKTLDESTSMKAMFGSYFFNHIQGLEKAIKELEQA